MIPTSNRFQQEIAENSSVLVRATLTLADGSERELTGDDFMMGGASFTQAVSSSASFDIGAAVIGSCELTLNNIDGRFDSYDFSGARVKPFVGKELSDGTTEWVRKPAYLVDQPSSYGNSIVLSGLDSMSAFERAYSDVATQYPASLATIVNDICRVCEVTLASTEFPNRSYQVSGRPSDDSLTCLAMLSYVAQVAGCWCAVDNSDRLVIGWYNTSVWEREAWLDGGSYDGDETPYADGDAADGGDFENYGGGVSADGGDFEARPYVTLSACSSLTVCTDDVVVTGVQVTAADKASEDGLTSDEQGETVLSGKEGYVLAISSNPLVEFGRANEVASYLAGRIAGMRFRPFTASSIGDPSVEAGDPVMVIDRYQRTYKSYVTSYTYKAGSYASVGCSAETPSRNSSERFSAATKAIVDIRNSIRHERTARQQAIDGLNQQLAQSGGLYSTAEAQPDGSVIYYLHDKPTIAESKVVWKMTADAIGISTDGGKTYAHGLTATGDAILNRVYAIGIDAEYVNTGRISDKLGKNYIDLDTGEVRLSADATVEGSHIATQEEAISSVDVEYAQGTSGTVAPTSGWVTTAPAWVDGMYIWQRTKTTTQDGKSTYSPPVMISGRDGKDGEPGPAGTDTFFHVAYAVSPDGKQGFSTTVSEGKTYIGTYVDSTRQDSEEPGDYTWALFKGKDGIPGTNGKDGTTYYLHIAYATSADGTQGFSTSVSAGKTHMGQCVDVSPSAPNTPGSYRWSLIQGATGADGIGVSAIAEQWYLSSSSTTQSGGSWSTEQPYWSKGRYIWTRSQITWTDGQVTYTAPVLAKAVNGANEAVQNLDTKLDQQEVFNRLTNNGASKGIYMTGGMLFVNADFIQTGTINANNVGITNLMKIGDDSDSVTVDSNSIAFKVDGIDDAMRIEANTYSMYREFFAGSAGGYLVGSEGDGFSRTWDLQKPFAAYRVLGGMPMVKFDVTICAYRSGSNYVLSATNNIPVSATSETLVASLMGSRIKVYANPNGGSPKLRITGDSTTAAGVYIRSVEVAYSVSSMGGQIYTSGGETFLTSNNFGSEMFGGELYTGEVRTSFYNNNIARQHVYTFRNGLLVDYQTLATGDAGFNGNYLG